MIQPLKTPRQPTNPFTRDVAAALRRANRKVWLEAARLGHKLAITDGGKVKLVQPRGSLRKNGVGSAEKKSDNHLTNFS